MDFKEITQKESVIYHGRILTLKNDTVLLPNGKTAQREVVCHSGGSCIYCERDGKVLLVKQFRYPYKKNLLELPAGKLNANESPKKTAVRELEEECGYKAEQVTLLFKVYPSPGYTDEIIYIYKAEGLKKSKKHPDEDEFVSSRWIEKSRLKKMVDGGKIKDAKTLIALLKIL